MLSSDTERESGSVRLDPIPSGFSGEALILQLSGLPIQANECKIVRRFLDALTSAVMGQWKITYEVFIHAAALQHKDGSSIHFSSKGKDWLPRLGLGVWPDRRPPAIWTREDFDNLGPGQKPRTLRNQVFQITHSPKAREEARNSMLGWGGMMQVMSADGQKFLERSREALLPAIKDPCFNCFPFYLPLLEGKSLMHGKADELNSWLCGASVYIRESPEDRGILIVSTESLQPIFKVLGASCENDKSVTWRVPV
jgi:hypothetical protein